MPYSVRFCCDKKRFDKKKDKDAWERSIADLVSLIVSGDGTVYEKESGSRWRLGGANNWFLNFEASTCTFTLNHRDGVNLKTFEKEILTVILWRLGWTHTPQPEGSPVAHLCLRD